MFPLSNRDTESPFHTLFIILLLLLLLIRALDTLVSFHDSDENRNFGTEFLLFQRSF
jgi:hypothetical protein